MHSKSTNIKTIFPEKAFDFSPLCYCKSIHSFSAAIVKPFMLREWNENIYGTASLAAGGKWQISTRTRVASPLLMSFFPNLVKAWRLHLKYHARRHTQPFTNSCWTTTSDCLILLIKSTMKPANIEVTFTLKLAFFTSWLPKPWVSNGSVGTNDFLLLFSIIIPPLNCYFLLR